MIFQGKSGAVNYKMCLTNCGKECPHLPPKKDCGHHWECGCDKIWCEECLLDGENKFCEDESCCGFYWFRNDNCDCDGFKCGYCNPVLVCKLCNDGEVAGG